MRVTNSQKIDLMRLAVEIERNKDKETVIVTYKELLKNIDRKEANRLDSEIIPCPEG